MHNPEFEWTISTDKLQVEALGTVFSNVSLKKNISLLAFNGLPGVTISNFTLPSDDPAGGIHIETDAAIPSPARLLQFFKTMCFEVTHASFLELGIDLGNIGFLAYFENVEVGREYIFSHHQYTSHINSSSTYRELVPRRQY